MDDDKVKDVPYIVFESAMAREERHCKRLTIALVIAVIAMLLSNLAWLWVWNSYEYVGDTTSKVLVDSGEGGNANYIGNDGDITNGESVCSEDSNEIPQEEKR